MKRDFYSIFFALLCINSKLYNMNKHTAYAALYDAEVPIHIIYKTVGTRGAIDRSDCSSQLLAFIVALQRADGVTCVPILANTVNTLLVQLWHTQTSCIWFICSTLNLYNTNAVQQENIPSATFNVTFTYAIKTGINITYPSPHMYPC